MDTFPVLPGLGWSVTKAPKFASRVQTAVSGRELRVVDQPYPIWTWTLVYEFLRDGHGQRGMALGQGYDELRTLAGFFLRQQGQFNTFLYQDPTDYIAPTQLLALGDGASTVFQLVRTFGGFPSPPVVLGTITIYVNGVSVPFTNYVPQPPFYAGQPPAGILLQTPPAPGALVVAAYYDLAPVPGILYSQVLGQGDGVTVSFGQLVQTVGGFNEPITQPTTVVIYLGGLSVPFTLGNYGVVTLASAPGVNVAVTASFQYEFPVRFSDDTQEYENFMYQLWSLKQLKFQSVILP